jgi:hypothetical protein
MWATFVKCSAIYQRSRFTASLQARPTGDGPCGLRDYGTGLWEGGDPGCDHDENAPKIRERSNFNEGFNERWGVGTHGSRAS